MKLNHQIVINKRSGTKGAGWNLDSSLPPSPIRSWVKGNAVAKTIVWELNIRGGVDVRRVGKEGTAKLMVPKNAVSPGVWGRGGGWATG